MSGVCMNTIMVCLGWIVLWSSAAVAGGLIQCNFIQHEHHQTYPTCRQTKDSLHPRHAGVSRLPSVRKIAVGGHSEGTATAQIHVPRGSVDGSVGQRRFKVEGRCWLLGHPLPQCHALPTTMPCRGMPCHAAYPAALSASRPGQHTDTARLARTLTLFLPAAPALKVTTAYTVSRRRCMCKHAPTCTQAACTTLVT
jgi:hypothetical protein